MGNYTRDKDGYCNKCRKKVRLVRCWKCQGKVTGTSTTDKVCNNTGYTCQHGAGDQHHQWW